MDNLKPPELVIFDLYGTLIKFGVMHHPFRELLKWARENGREVRNDDARVLMTTNTDLHGLSVQLGIDAPWELLTNLQIKINEELASLTLFDDVLPVLSKLQELNIPIAICSNLAQPYGVVIKKLLPQFQLQKFLSYEVGFIKPEFQIYDLINEVTGIPKASSLFIGDTYLADYEGPIKNGFQARHLIHGHRCENYVIGTLTDILATFEA